MDPGDQEWSVSMTFDEFEERLTAYGIAVQDWADGKSPIPMQAAKTALLRSVGFLIEHFALVKEERDDAIGRLTQIRRGQPAEDNDHNVVG